MYSRHVSLRRIVLRHARHVALALAATLAALGASHAAPGPRDPVEGRWAGTIGTPKERITVGLEFVRPEGSDALRLKLTQPMLSLYGIEVPDAVERDGDVVRVPSQYLELKLDGGRLVGHYPGPNSPATFERSNVLPREPALPRVPVGPEPLWQLRIGAQVYATPAVA
jgi:hypothetical protein